MGESAPFTDLIRPFRIEALGLRGRLVRLGPALDQVLAAHAYPEPVGAMLAQAMTLAATLVGALRLDGSLKLQTQGDGPIGMMVVDARSDGGLRGYARFDADALAAVEDGDSAPVPRLLGQGRMAVTIDHGPAKQRFQGVVGLEGATLADCAHAYFRQSEPIDTAIVLVARAAAPARAAALMIERPNGGADESDPFVAEEAEDGWRTAVALTGSATAGELLDAELAPESLLYRLYHEHGVRMFGARPLRHACGCSRDKVAATLAGFAPADRAAMAVDGAITVTCEFCKSDYVFRDSDLEGIDTP